MTTLQDILTARIALLPVADRVVPTQLAYGTDLSCVSDLTPTMEEVTPNSGRAVSQISLRRVSTPRGSVRDGKSWGIDVRSYLSRGVTADALRVLEATIRSEIGKDSRIARTDVVLVSSGSQATPRLTVTVTLTLVGATQKFQLVFFVTADGVELLGSINKNG